MDTQKRKLDQPKSFHELHQNISAVSQRVFFHRQCASCRFPASNLTVLKILLFYRRRILKDGHLISDKQRYRISIGLEILEVAQDLNYLVNVLFSEVRPNREISKYID